MKRSGKPATCGAKTRSGTPCKRIDLGQGGRCKLHGGASLAGIAAGGFKHGKRSAYLPAKLAERVREMMADPALRGMRTHLAMLDVRISDVAHRLEEREPSVGDAAAAFEAFKAAQADGNVDAAREALAALERALAGAVDERVIWRELRELTRDRDRILTNEAARLEKLSQTMSLGQAMSMVMTLATAVREVVTDPAQRRELQRRMQTALGVSAYRAGAVPPVIDTAAEAATP